MGSFPLIPATTQSGEFETNGTDIWNLSTRLLRTERGDGGRIPCLLRVFSCFLLHGAEQCKSESWSNAIRILKVVLRAAKTCLQQLELPLGTKMLELAAMYLQKASKITDISPEDLEIYTKLSNQNFLLRIILVGFVPLICIMCQAD